MAQRDQRPRHSRHPSRIQRLINSDSSNLEKVRVRNSNDEASIRHIKRHLCFRPNQQGPARDVLFDEIDSKPLEELLPPLTSSNDVDIQLYAIIATVINLFVQNWYNRITPDHDFVSEILQIIAHCTRGLEQRFRNIDLEGLVFDELPRLFATHIGAVKVARGASSTQAPLENIHSIYHSIHPMKALTPLPVTLSTSLEQEENEIAWSQLLVSQVLPLVLPPEDLQNPCLQVLVSEVFSEMIVHNALCRKGSEPWVLWEGVTKVIYSVRSELRQPQTPGTVASPAINRLEQFGLLSSAKVTQIQDSRKTEGGWFEFIAQAFWSALQILSVSLLLLRSFTVALIHASSLPTRLSQKDGEASWTSETSEKSSIQPVLSDSDLTLIPDSSTSRCPVVEKRPILTFGIWSCLLSITSLEQRMPWLTGSFSLVQWILLHGPWRLGRTDGVLDRLMSSQIQTRALRTSVLVQALRAVRAALFPENALAPTRATPTSDEVLEIRRAAAKAIVDAVPEPLRNRFFATKDVELMCQDVEYTLDLFGDAYINKHFIISAVDLIAVRLFPELADDQGQEAWS